MNGRHDASVPEAQQCIFKLAQGFIASQVLFVANEHKIIPFLETPKSLQEVVAFTGWPLNSTQRMLDALLALGLVAKQGVRYGNTAVASACLLTQSPHFQGNIISHLKNVSELWQGLEASLCSGSGKPF